MEGTGGDRDVEGIILWGRGVEFVQGSGAYLEQTVNVA